FSIEKWRKWAKACRKNFGLCEFFWGSLDGAVAGELGAYVWMVYRLITFSMDLPRGSASPVGLIQLSDKLLSPFVSLLAGRFNITMSPVLSARCLIPFLLDTSLPFSVSNVTR